MKNQKTQLSESLKSSAVNHVPCLVMRPFIAGFIVLLLLWGATQLSAVPPYGDPNQPYDKLPGTWETYHVKWLKPLAEGKRKVLFIVPFASSREVVELAQRLDLEYTVIMNAGRSSWACGGGGGGGPEPTTLMGVEAKAVLEKIASERLNLAFHYDAIVIGKTSWEVIPEKYRLLILEHVKRGTGLTYVSPNRLKHVLDGEVENSREQGVETNTNETYEKLFRTNEIPAIGATITAALPLDVIPMKLLDSPGDFEKLAKVQPHSQVPVCITATRHGQGRVICIQYFDIELGDRVDAPLTPNVEYNKTTYDYFQALLARCVRWSAGWDATVKAEITVAAPATNLKEPEDKEQMKYCYEFKTPKAVIDRKDLDAARIVFSLAAADGKPREVRLDYQVRDMARNVLLQGDAPLHVAGGTPATNAIPLPPLSRGNYLVDLRIIDAEKKIVDFVSKSFRVESAPYVTGITTANDRYKPGQVITGNVTFSASLSENQKAEVRSRDTWNRIAAKQPITLSADRTGGTFTLPVDHPLAGLWDIIGSITDTKGEVASAKTWVGIPQYEFDNFIINMTFCEGPGGGWKGCMAAESLRRFGVNSYLSAILYQPRDPGMTIERHNMRNLFYGDHFGQYGNPKARGPYDVEFSESCMSEMSKILRYTADTGELPDTGKFPYKFNCGQWDCTADHFKGRIVQEYIPSGKFSTPLYILTGETYQSGDCEAQENGCFCPLCTKKFQDWCKKEYGDDLKALNAEWNTTFTAWDQVRGILMMEAVNKDQLPRWVDFRYFMRSRVWTQFFIDYTDMIRRFVPDARTGRIGHAHYDFSRFRNHMTSTKIYQEQDANPELHTMVEPELLTSFSDDNSIMIGSTGIINWSPMFRTHQTCTRWPWKMLFMGFRGYDMERHLTGSRLGGESWTTPCMSERMPFFADMSDQIMFLQRGIASLVSKAKPYRSKVAVLWSPRNHYISRLDPFQENAFTGSWLYNICVEFGAPHDCLALLKSIRIRGKIVAPEDIIAGVLKKENYKALFLPFSKGMSLAEAEAIRKFVKEGGLLIADNTPGIYSEHGRKLEKSRLSDLFPVMDKKNVVPYGKGYTAYLHNEMNGYMARMENGDYTGSDMVALLLKKYAGITTPVELVHDNGTPRRDTLMPVYKKGSATYFGLLRHETSKEDAPTTVTLERKYHVWNVREQAYLGYLDSFRMNLDMTPGFYALLPANPAGLALKPEKDLVRQGEVLNVSGKVAFEGGTSDEIAGMGQVVNIRVFTPDGTELEWFRNNVVFDGGEFRFALPISYSEQPGMYAVVAEHTITGLKAKTTFEVTK